LKNGSGEDADPPSSRRAAFHGRAIVPHGPNLSREAASQGWQNYLTTIKHGGRCEKEQPKVGPKGEGAGATESKDTESTE
jgi:hypothetical protein